MKFVYIHYTRKFMRNRKKWIAGLLVMLLLIQSFSAIDFDFLQAQVAYANTELSSKQQQATGENKEREVLTDTQVNIEKIKDGEFSSELMPMVNTATTDSATFIDVENSARTVNLEGTLGTCPSFR